MGSINWFSIIIAVLIPLVMGFAWYHKALFGQAWMKETGITDEKAKEANMGLTFGLSIVMSLLLAFFFLNFNNGPGQENEFDTFKHGAFHGLFVGIVIVIPVFVTNGLFEMRSWKYMFINIGYWLVTFTLMGGVLDAMNSWNL